jgi:hypothetical protein
MSTKTAVTTFSNLVVCMSINYIPDSDDMMRNTLLLDRDGVIFDNEEPDDIQFGKVRYFFKHGAQAYIVKYGRSSKRIYESLGLDYPGDPQ